MFKKLLRITTLGFKKLLSLIMSFFGGWWVISVDECPILIFSRTDLYITYLRLDNWISITLKLRL